MTSLEGLENQLKKIAEKRNRAIGMLEQIKKDMKEKYGISSASEAHNKINELTQELEVVEKKYKKGLEDFNNEYSERIKKALS